MANVSISSVLSGTGTNRSSRNIVFVSAAIGYSFFVVAGGFSYKKTTDGGATWSSVVNIATATPIAFDVWFDQWTPGDTGTLIHCWYFEATNNKVFWRSLDTNGDTLGTERTAFTGVSAVAGRGAFCSGTKSRSGYLYVAFDLDAGAEHGLVRSTDSGTTWSANLASTFVEATIDDCLLFPATGTGDNNDIWAIYQDASADALTIKMWDSSGAAEVESSTVQTMVENTTDGTGQRGFSGAIRFSDGDLIVVSCSERDTATADMQAWDVSGVTAASLTGITAKTDITTNIDDNYNPAVCIDQDTNTIYVAYNGKRDGSETIGTTTKIYYTKSTDGGSTWTAGDTALDEASATTNLQVWAPLSGHRFTAVWRSSATLNTNKVNSVILYTLVAGQGSFTHTGQAVTLTYTPAGGSATIVAALGSFSDTGQTANLLAGHKLAVDFASFSDTGQTANLLLGAKLSAAQGSFTLSGQDASLIYTPVGAFTLAANYGSFALTGEDVTLKVSLPVAQGSFTLTGQAVAFTVAHKLSATQASFTLSGEAADLIYTPVGAFTLAANHGTFTLSGQSVLLEHGRFLVIGAGLFSETGQAVAFSLGKVLAGAYGSFIVSGQAADLVFQGILGIHPTAGEFALNGQSIFFSFNYALLKLDFDAPTDAQAQFSAAGEAGSQISIARARSRISVGKAESSLTTVLP